MSDANDRLTDGGCDWQPGLAGSGNRVQHAINIGLFTEY